MTTPTTPSAEDLFGGSGAPGIKWAEVGMNKWVSGTVLDVQVRQSVDFETQTPETWPDGKPKMQVVLTLDDGTEEGCRAFIQGHLFTATRDALRAAGEKAPKVGGKYAAAWVGEGDAPRQGMARPRLFKVSYQPPSPAARAEQEAGDLFGAPVEDPWAESTTPGLDEPPF